jgi:cytochrome d ubiquinol oxidase subunit I
MNDFLAARYQMAISLGFHIVYAAIGMTMPFFMFVAEYKWLKTGNEAYLQLAKAWSKGVAIFFAIGAVSGTVISFELGLLWPGFMKHAGPIIGMPFSWEGAAFFVEAIALGLFLYGWNKLSRRVHLASGLLVGLAGVASGFIVISANGWMNSPSGFDWINGCSYVQCSLALTIGAYDNRSVCIYRFCSCRDTCIVIIEKEKSRFS